MLTRLLLEQATWVTWSREAMKAGLTMADLMRMRPIQLVATYFDRPAAGAVSADPLTALLAMNRALGKRWRMPVCPPTFRAVFDHATRPRTR